MQTKEQAIETINNLLKANHDAPAGHIEKLADRTLLDCNPDEMWVDYAFVVPKTAENYTGTVHGGFLAAMADAGMSIGARGLIGYSGTATTTIDISINAIKAMHVGEYIRMRCTLLHVGKRIILATADFYRGDEHCASVTSNYMRLPVSHVQFTEWSRI